MGSVMEQLLDQYGAGPVLFALGGLVGLLFGAAALTSRFCLRAACVELSEGAPGPRLSIWLIAFFTAVVLVQTAILAGWLSVADARQLANQGSLSGAMVGGLMFGAGMILARGCASRLLVLAATGNLRAIVTGLFLTLIAQAALSGALSPLRSAIAGLWQVDGGATRDLLRLLGLGNGVVTGLSVAALSGALLFARSLNVAWARVTGAALVGVAVAAGWVGTYQISQISFDIVTITSVTFTGPSTDTLMGLVNAPRMPLGFGVGLVPGVAIGAGLSAIVRREWRIQRFGPDTPMERYLIGAALMGFGSMLAGGCAVGTGMSGGAIFSLTAWLAVFFMWLGAMLTHRLLMLSGQSAAI